MNIIDKTILSNLGLNKSEIEIYLFLLQSKVQSVKQISQATKINRTTVYRHLDSLEKKMLIKWVVGERGKKSQIASLDNLSLFIKQKKKAIEEVEEILPDLISQLSLIKPVEKFATQVRYYNDKRGIEQIIWNTLSTIETLRSYTKFGRREFISTKFEDEFETEWVNRGLSDRIITNDNRLEYIKKKLVAEYKQTLEIRIIPSVKYYITNDILIYNNIVAIVDLEKDDLVGVEIENAEIAKTQKSIFDIIWDVALPIKKFENKV